MSQEAILTSRGIIRISGPDAESWLQGLVTNDVANIAPGEARFAALLSPQGKILFDFFVFRDGHDLLLDCLQERAADLVKRLSMYKLRSNVTISDFSDSETVEAVWGDNDPPGGVYYRDPRHGDLGWRLVVPRPGPSSGGVANDNYERHRITCGVPRSGYDFGWDDTFPHEANMDKLNGIDFKKGCYIGQEVVSRVEHRGTARKRIVKVRIHGEHPPRLGTEISAGDIRIGVMGSAHGDRGLAMLRLDRVEDAKAKGVELKAGEAIIVPE